MTTAEYCLSREKNYFAEYQNSEPNIQPEQRYIQN